MAEPKELHDETTQDYLVRTSNRTAKLGQSTMALLLHLITLETDPDETIKYDNAKLKVQQLSQEISTSKPGAKTDYMLGDTAELINCVNASVLTFMDSTAKLIVVDILNQL